MQLKLTGMVGLLISAFTATAGAQGLTAVRPLDGYICMGLNRTEAQMFDPNAAVAVRESSTPSSRQIGNAAATAIVSKEPAVNGYRKVLLPDGKPGWIASGDLKPWVNLGTNGHSCHPSVMSNGRLGYDFRAP